MAKLYRSATVSKSIAIFRFLPLDSDQKLDQSSNLSSQTGVFFFSFISDENVQTGRTFTVFDFMLFCSEYRESTDFCKLTRTILQARI